MVIVSLRASHWEDLRDITVPVNLRHVPVISPEQNRNTVTLIGLNTVGIGLIFRRAKSFKRSLIATNPLSNHKNKT